MGRIRNGGRKQQVRERAAEGTARPGSSTFWLEASSSPRKEGEDQEARDQPKKHNMRTRGVKGVAGSMPVEEQEGEEGRPTEAGGGTSFRKNQGRRMAATGLEKSCSEARRTRFKTGWARKEPTPRGGRSHYAGSSHLGAAREGRCRREVVKSDSSTRDVTM